MSETLAQFHFLRPAWLAALPLLLLVLWGLARRGRRASVWQGVCDTHLLPHLLVQTGAGGRALLPLWLLALGWLVTVLALAGPTWNRYPQAVFQTQQARVIVLDLSRSMDATDLKPSRLARARFKIADLLAAQEDAQNGLVVFSGAAFVVVPLTQDSATLNALLPALESDIMPVAGSRIDLGLKQAVEVMRRGGASRGDIILITDAQPDHRAVQAARELREQGFSLSVLGLGSAGGSPIPIGNGELLKDAQGDIVIARLDSAALRELARSGGGRYAGLRADAGDLAVLLDDAKPLTTPAQRSEQRIERWQERGPWLILLLLPLAALAFRRGWLA